MKKSRFIEERWGTRSSSPDLLADRPPCSDDHGSTHAGRTAMNYVGLDVSLNSVAICVVDGTGRLMREGIARRSG